MPFRSARRLASQGPYDDVLVLEDGTNVLVRDLPADVQEAYEKVAKALAAVLGA